MSEIKTYYDIYEKVEKNGLVSIEVKPKQTVTETWHVRGGHGNARLMAWEFEKKIDSVSEQQKEIRNTINECRSILFEHEQPRKLEKVKLDSPNKNIIDYKDNSTFPDEWKNIESGKGRFKLRKKDKLALTGLTCLLIGAIITIVCMIF